ncbi:GNAT family N-acetyltransferase [Dongia mobilis]|uniref:GNAT family N-acetyltransferase n=1 Tax=Dongia sp. TaxID=1977262 RepID=UPI0026E98E96
MAPAMESQNEIPTIRPARATDAAGIARVHVETWQDAYAGLLPDKHLLRLNAQTHALAWTRNLSLAEGPRHAMVAVVTDDMGGEDVVGFVNFGPARESRPKDEGEVFMLYVATDWREQGIGRALIGAAFAALRTRGCKAVSIWCLSDNVAAIGFYQHLGGARIPESRQENVGGAMFPVVGFIWPLS